MTRHLIQGREIATPVHIRNARVCTASYLVRADAARAVIAYSRLDIAEVLPGRTLCTLVFADYTDGDLDAYREFGVIFPSLLPGPASQGPPTRPPKPHRTGIGAFVHWLPVDQSLTMEAGRAIWGFPKELADIDLRLSSPYKRCVVRKDGRMVLDLLVKPGLPVPVGGTTAPPDAYTHLDGVIRRTRWSVSPRQVRVRPGGALIRLGNHPIAKELSELGLPKRALVTTTTGSLAMTLDEARRL